MNWWACVANSTCCVSMPAMAAWRCFCPSISLHPSPGRGAGFCRSAGPRRSHAYCACSAASASAATESPARAAASGVPSDWPLGGSEGGPAAMTGWTGRSRLSPSAVTTARRADAAASPTMHAPAILPDTCPSVMSTALAGGSDTGLDDSSSPSPRCSARATDAIHGSDTPTTASLEHAKKRSATAGSSINTRCSTPSLSSSSASSSTFPSMSILSTGYSCSGLSVLVQASAWHRVRRSSPSSPVHRLG
mmetsp:Transcript_7970/g.19042  ORF Transcript_7970/g.19042 Transcript_7970/m.19042 type:complete len:249 (+) Transcript_7970:169-915(+)